MNNNQNKKRALTASILSMVVCLSLILGSTLAWFSSTVSNTENPIQAGQLKVALYQDKSDNGTYTDATNQTLFNGNTIWEPNKTEIVYLQVKNIENLALNYKVTMNVEAVAGTPNTKPLADALDYALIPGATKADFDAKVTAGTVTDWESLLTAYGVAAKDMPLSGTELDLSGELDGKLVNDETDGGYDNFALVLHMDKNAGNSYQGGKINVALTVDAWQMSSESDIFGTQYDAAAKYVDPADFFEGMGDFEDASWYTENIVKRRMDNGKKVNGTTDLAALYEIGEDGENHYLRIKQFEASNTGTKYGLSLYQTLCQGLDSNCEYEVVFKCRVLDKEEKNTERSVTVKTAGYSELTGNGGSNGFAAAIGGTANSITITGPVTEWTEYRLPIPAGAESFVFVIGATDIDKTEVHIDDIQVIKKTSTVSE